MKLITEEWLDRAKEDLDVAAEIIAREHLTNMVAFHSQQAVEKTLKGVVEEFEIGFVKIHNLERLLGIVRKKISLKKIKVMRAKINLGLLLNDLNAVSSNQFFIRADLLKSVSHNL